MVSHKYSVASFFNGNLTHNRAGTVLICVHVALIVTIWLLLLLTACRLSCQQCSAESQKSIVTAARC